ncbi:MAG: hypothetical protein JNL32_06415 [Candidatus Kapabacteria bacterium]|nr:hypothetical protein [Candidatus Kapabacteria bacterium]
MKLLKLDSLGRTIAGLLAPDDVPPRVGYVGQFTGNVEFTVNAGATGLVSHQNARIVKDSIVEVVSLSPAFVLRPRVKGFYLIHHQRRDFIYSASAVPYTVTLAPSVATAARGLDANVECTNECINGTLHDICTTHLTYGIYCNGTTDTISLSLWHSSTIARTFGSLSAQNSIAHTTVMFAGEEPHHAVIP